MKNCLFFFVAFTLFFSASLVHAQTLDFFYAFAKKTSGGILLGVETQAQKDGILIPPEQLSYKWNLYAGTTIKKSTLSPVLKIMTPPGTTEVSGSVTIAAYRSGFEASRNFSLFLPGPRASIVKYDPSLNLFLPLSLPLLRGQMIGALVFSFSVPDNQLSYSWKIGNASLASSQFLQIAANQLSIGDGTSVTVSNTSYSREFAQDQKTIIE